MSQQDQPSRPSFQPVKLDTLFGDNDSSDDLNGCRDFVLICEFSEMEGPLPLAVVTDSAYLDLKHYGTPEVNLTLMHELSTMGLARFNFNALALRVVSADRGVDEQFGFENGGNFHDISTAQQLQGEGKNANPWMFSIPDDTQMYFTDPENKFFIFTHHLTLFDINARGYVHPVALSYVTHDSEKIIFRFEEFMEQFSEVSRLMKKGNFANFALDLKRRLFDLEYTEQILKDRTILSQKQNCQNMSVDAVQQAVAITKLMLDTVESNATQTSREKVSERVTSETFVESPSPYETAKEQQQQLSRRIPRKQKYLSNFGRLSGKPHAPKYVETLHPVAHFERKLRTLAQLCEDPDIDINPDGTQYSLPQATVIPLASVLEPQLAQLSLSKKKKSTTSSIHDMYAEAIQCIMGVLKYLGRDSVALDVEEEEELFLGKSKYSVSVHFLLMYAFKEPSFEAISIGRTFILNMDNPRPRGQEPISNESIQSNNCTYINNTGDSSQSMSSSYTSRQKQDTHQKNTAGRFNNDDFFPIFSESSLLSKVNQKRESRSLLDVLKSLRHLLCHIIFSLMTGRPVIVVGKTQSKSRVEEIVETLSLFLPGHSRHRHSIARWFTDCKLTEDQLSSIKLVGTTVDNVDMSVHRLEISYLDVDANDSKGDLVTSPLYLDGIWINQIVDHLRFFSVSEFVAVIIIEYILMASKSDQAYLAYVHTVFATMALKAYIYRHMYVGEDEIFDGIDIGESTSKGYTSESSLDGNGLSRTWSVRRVMNYLKRIEEREQRSEKPTSTVTTPVSESLPSSLHAQILKRFQIDLANSPEEEDNLSDENEATVTLQSVNEQPTSLLDFNWYPPSVLDPDIHRRPSESFSECSSSATNYFQDRDISSDNEEEDLSSGSSKDSLCEENPISEQLCRGSQPEDLGSDGLSSNERRGRRFLQEKLDVYGDDQTIIVHMQENLTLFVVYGYVER
ncbi:Guanine nucleotide exchange protein smcr8 [Apophysomyces ossiformis]|uniref:Guanine nucleotide exchange protein smcr8 n=1 Tax=Apophysomyces ossiformis TaxID=679940 RepID=A0A8H7BTX2_9FUNG|nr:Guanine nucleotide exchange protein smcr8 [Apophysomyces ossiformis]